MAEFHQVVVLLGSNIDKEHNLPAAVRLLAAAEPIIAISSVYETPAVGTRVEQGSYFNAAVLLNTTLSPSELKDGLLSAIEQKLGRRRTADKFGPRTIDLDIAWYDDEAFDYIPADGRSRHIPDPDLLRHPHSALPVAELLPHALHPETGEPLAAIAERILAAIGPAQYSTIIKRPDFDLVATARRDSTSR